MSDLQEDLAAGAQELRETHISWVFLREDTVLKVKKPVNFGFLDFSDRESRRRACEAEVELNARLAPNVYLGVVPITRDAAGHHAVQGSGRIVDWAVQMRRLRDADRADERLAAGRWDGEMLGALARRLARFHREAASDSRIAEFGRVAQIRQNVLENFAQTHSALTGLVSEAAQREVEAWQLGFLERQGELFDRRIQAGRIRDGHGDLRLEHVYLDTSIEPGGEPTIIDCIEFNERFRYADVCADVAFLSMDLAFHDRVQDKERFLALYARESNDYDAYALVDFYESYRAYVRAKISALGFAQASSAVERQQLESRARRYFLLSQASERPALRAPQLIALGGVIASGKSSVGRALGAALAIPMISSDRVRKALHGVDATTPLGGAAFGSGYSNDVTERVYDETLRQAEVVLASGRSVIVDASFRTLELRSRARRAAARVGVAFWFVECQAPPELCRARLAERAAGPSESDGRAEIFDEFLARYEPVLELAPGEHIRVDTSGSLERSLAALRGAGLL